MRHPVYGPLMIVLFCVFLALLFLHTSNDGAHEGAFVCLTLAVAFGLVLVVRPRPGLGPVFRLFASRAPPQPLTVFFSPILVLPLARPAPLRR